MKILLWIIVVIGIIGIMIIAAFVNIGVYKKVLGIYKIEKRITTLESQIQSMKPVVVKDTVYIQVLNHSQIK